MGIGIRKRIVQDIVHMFGQYAAYGMDGIMSGEAFGYKTVKRCANWRLVSECHLILDDGMEGRVSTWLGCGRMRIAQIFVVFENLLDSIIFVQVEPQGGIRGDVYVVRQGTALNVLQPGASRLLCRPGSQRHRLDST